MKALALLPLVLLAACGTPGPNTVLGQVYRADARRLDCYTATPPGAGGIRPNESMEECIERGAADRHRAFIERPPVVTCYRRRCW